MALTRSEVMARIRSKNTTPEQVLRRALWSQNYRYRLHYKTPVGRPDIVFPGRKVAVFIDGCFWHGCTDHYVRPRSRHDFWAEKLATNVARDQRQTGELEALGWRVVRVWEHAVFEALEEVVAEVVASLEAEEWRPKPQQRVIQADPIDEAGSRERRTHVPLRAPFNPTEVERPRHTKQWKRPSKKRKKRVRSS